MSREAALNLATGTSIVTIPENKVVNEIPKEVITPPLDSERFAKLAAKEAQIIKDREAFKAEKLIADQEKVKLAEYKRTIDEFEELKKTDKIAALKKIGFSEEDIFNFLSGKEEPKEPTAAELATKAAQEEIQKLRDENKVNADKAETERNDRAIKAYKESIGEVIKKDLEKYEFCNHYGPVAEEIIYETILGFMADDAELTPHDAMKAAIEAVEKMYEDEDKKMNTLKKRGYKAPEPPKEIPLKAEVNGRTTLRPPEPVKTESPIIKKETKSEKRERLINMLTKR